MATMRCEPPAKGRKAAVFALYAGSVAIVAAGLAFGVYSALYHVAFSAMGMQIPGVIFAAFAVFLGVRYFRSVQKLSKNLVGTNQGFRWSNFKRDKTKKMEG